MNPAMTVCMFISQYEVLVFINCIMYVHDIFQFIGTMAQELKNVTFVPLKCQIHDGIRT